MTTDELAQDMERFTEYLRANGVTVLCGHMTVADTDGTRMTITSGDPHWQAFALAATVIWERGYEIKRKDQL